MTSRRFVRLDADKRVTFDITVHRPTDDWSDITTDSGVPDGMIEIHGDPGARNGRLNGHVRKDDGTFAPPTAAARAATRSTTRKPKEPTSAT